LSYAVIITCIAPDGCGDKYTTHFQGEEITEGKDTARVRGQGDTYTISVLVKEPHELLVATVKGAEMITRIAEANGLPQWPAHRLDVIRHYDKVGP
jgi:hypothetical protein